MPTITRRAHLAGLAGAAAAVALPRALLAQPPAAKPVPAEVGADIPPEGIGRGIRHLSYSDVGGRPDTVQVMVNRGHLYVGHMFSDGVTVLDARDPRKLKPVQFFTAAAEHAHASSAGRRRLPAARERREHRRACSRTTTRATTSRTRWPTASRSGSRSAPDSAIFDIAKNPAEPREIAFLEMPGIGINRLWWAGGRYAYVSAHFDGFTDHILVHRRSAGHHEAARSCRAGGCPA